MMIPNKFNGYSRDGIRLYNDPVTLTALTAAGATTGTMAGTALTTSGALAGAAGAAGALGAAATMPGVMGGIGNALSPAAASTPGAATALGGSVAPEAAAALSPDVASNLAAAQQGINAPAAAGAPPPPPSAPPAPAFGDALTQAANTQGPAMPPPGMVNLVVPPAAPPTTPPSGPLAGIMQSDTMQTLKGGYDALSSGFETALKFSKEHPLATSLGLNAAQAIYNRFNRPNDEGGGGRRKPMPGFVPSEPRTSPYTPMFAVGGPVEQMSAANAIGNNEMYPQSQLRTPMYSNPMIQRPMPSNVITQGTDTPVDPYTGEEKFAGGGITEYIKQQEKERARQQELAEENLERSKSVSAKTKPYSRTQSTSSPYEAAVKELQALGKKYKIPVAPPAKTSVDVMGNPEEIEAAGGGIMYGLGGYSDGGRLLKGPGDGVSDSIPAVIGKHQPARLADGEFVIPARIVSELGNGSTEAGARKLYEMMDRVQKRRNKTVGKGKVAVDSKAHKDLPA